MLLASTNSIDLSRQIHKKCAPNCSLYSVPQQAATSHCPAYNSIKTRSIPFPICNISLRYILNSSIKKDLWYNCSPMYVKRSLFIMAWLISGAYIVSFVLGTTSPKLLLHCCTSENHIIMACPTKSKKKVTTKAWSTKGSSTKTTTAKKSMSMATEAKKMRPRPKPAYKGATEDPDANERVALATLMMLGWD
jgi:hypothetical protein